MSKKICSSLCLTSVRSLTQTFGRGNTVVTSSVISSLFNQSPRKQVNGGSVSTKAEMSTGRTRDKRLFTPGPLGVSLPVKEAMLRDVGSRDKEFISTVKLIRETLLDIAGVTGEEYTCIPLQGSGTFSMDAAFQTCIPREGSKVLIIENGAYGKRMAKICESAGIEHHVQSFREDQVVEAEVVEDALKGRTQYDLVSIVHSETSSGVINPIKDVGQLVKEYLPNAVYLVDAISSYGSVPVDLKECCIDVIVSSANKCFQGVPGFAFVIARRDLIEKCKGNSRSLSLDLHDQVTQLDKTGQFRFTPATHSMLAFKKALEEFKEEGGIEGRGKRYAENRRVLRNGMSEMGFKELLNPKNAGYIITSYMYPSDPNFDFPEFYNRLNDKGLVIYPGKVLDANCFRVGTIGDLYPQDMTDLLVAIKEVCHDMKISLPIQY